MYSSKEVAILIVLTVTMQPIGWLIGTRLRRWADDLDRRRTLDAAREGK